MAGDRQFNTRLRGLGIGGRIGAMVIVTMAFALAVGLFGLSEISSVASRGRAIYNDALLPVEDVMALREHVAMARFYGLSRANAGDDAFQQRYGDALAVEDQRIDEQVAQYGRYDLSREQRRAFETFVIKWNEYRKLRDELDILSRQGRVRESDQLRAERTPGTIEVALSALDDLRAQAERAARSRLAEQDRTTRRARLVILAVLGVGLLVASGFAVMIRLSIVRPLGRVRAVLDAIANGDLTQESQVIGGNDPGHNDLDEMATALRRVTARLRGLVHALTEHSTILSRHSDELRRTGRRTAGGSGREPVRGHGCSGRTEPETTRPETTRPDTTEPDEPETARVRRGAVGAEVSDVPDIPDVPDVPAHEDSPAMQAASVLSDMSCQLRMLAAAFHC